MTDIHAEDHPKSHPYHMVKPSPWPALGAFSALVLAAGFLILMKADQWWLFIIGVVLVLATMFLWWRDVISEGTFEDGATAVDDGDVVAEVLDEVELVAGEEDGGASGGLFADDFAEGLDADRVEAGEWFVEDEQVGFVGDGDDELDALLVAVRELLEAGTGAVGEAEAVEPVVGSLGGLGSVATVEAGEVDDLVADAHAWVEAALFWHVAEAAVFVVGDGLGVPAGGAGIEVDESEDAAHGGGFAGAVGSEEADHAAGAGAEVAALEGDDIAEALVEVGEFEH